MDKYLEIKRKCEEIEDRKNAISMAKYMRDLFPFYILGISSSKCKFENLIKNNRHTNKCII